MAKLLTKSSTKRITAAAIAEAKVRNDWSNADAGDALDCSEGTVRLRLADEDPKNQMTVHELRRVTAVDGPAIANGIIGDLGYRLVGVDVTPQSNCLGVAASMTGASAALLQALADGVITRDEAADLLPQLVRLCDSLVSFKAHLRGLIDGSVTNIRPREVA